jgi:hypothetical protein
MILGLFGGILHMLFGVNLHMRVAPRYPPFSVIGPIMILLGVISVSACIGLSQMKPWGKKTVTAVGLAITGTHILIVYYLMAAMSAIIYWLAINQLKSISFTESLE